MSSTLQPIHIIGAGIAGLTLARCLVAKGRSVILHDKAQTPPNHNYGITLHAYSYSKLLPLLSLDEDTFRRQLSVDGQTGGKGVVYPRKETSTLDSIETSFRANSGKLRRLLAEGLDIRWNHGLKSLWLGPGATPGTGEAVDNGRYKTSELDLSFDNGDTLSTDCLVAADGVHSAVRNCLLPHYQPTVLPYVTFSGGRRRLDSQEFQDRYAIHFKHATMLEHAAYNVYTRIAIIEKRKDHTDIGYIYSRPARPDQDPLHRPDRSTGEANTIPEEFFDELSSISTKLPPPFDITFNPDAVRKDRVVHWLMRSISIPYADMNVFTDNHIAVLGDAVHGTCILGGMGANIAIEDGVLLAEHIDKHGFAGLKEYYRERYPVWKREVDDSEDVIRNRHELDKTSVAPSVVVVDSRNGRL